MTDTLFPVEPLVPGEPDVVLSVGRRRTIAQHAALAAGRHPANGLPIDPSHTCGQCVHLASQGRWFKCRFHRLGNSASAASDMRKSWPACPRFTIGDPA